ncbi:putative enoyl-CoA hydratase echA8 isoform X2 [Ixodes scapularis]
MASGDLLVEISTKQQSDALLALNSVSDYKVTVSPHRKLNTVQGVISEDDLLDTSDAEGPARPVTASTGTQTSPDDLRLSLKSPPKPTGAVPVAPGPKPRVDAGSLASTSEQGKAPPGRGRPPRTSGPNRPGNLVVTEKQGRVLLVGINRPEKRNCVDSETACQLVQAFRDFDADDSVNVAVLHGKGGTFCAGYDLSELSEASDDSQLDEDNCSSRGCETGAGASAQGPSGMLTRKPTVAAVNGYAVAGGLELALWCDLRVVDETAVMGVFCRRFGVPLLDGGTVRLPALIGLSRALDLILTGRPVSAKEALDIGLANRVVSCGTALGQAISLAGSIAKFPQQCVRADRASAYHACFSGSLQEALAYERDNGKNVLAAESIQGAKKFVSGIGRHGSFNLLHAPRKDAS